MPKLSIGIPVFNGQEFLPELLDSLLRQTFADFEIVICDNASIDRTQDICREYARRDSRVRYTCNERNLGASPNHNRVFELSTAPFFKWAAHDDLYHNDYLEVCVRLLDENPDVVLAHTGTAFIDEAGELLPFEQETGSFVDPKTGRRYWPDVPSIGDTPIATSRLWQVLTRALWGLTCSVLCAARFCSKRPFCHTSKAVTARCWRNWRYSAASSVPTIGYS